LGAKELALDEAEDGAQLLPEKPHPSVTRGTSPLPGGSRREGAVLRQPQVGLLQLLHVDVLERDDPDVLDEPGRTVHVPYPGVRHAYLEVDLSRGVAHLHVDRVGQVEPSLGLHHVGELTDDVAILAIERQLHLGLVLLEVLRAHPVAAPPSCSASSKLPFSPTSNIAAPSGSEAHAALRIDAALRWIRRGGTIPCCMPAMATLANDHRCSSHGPWAVSAAQCSVVLYPLCTSKPYCGYRSCSSIMIRSLVTLASTDAAATHATARSPLTTGTLGAVKPGTRNPSMST